MSGKAIRETVGFLAVVASLVFVGLEVRQGAAATRAATVLQLKDTWVQTNLATATSRELNDAFVAVEDNLSPEPQAREMVRSFYRVLFHNWSNAYYQFLNGTLPEGQWLPHLREAEDFATRPFTWLMWDDIQIVYDDDFRALIDSIRLDAEVGGATP